MKATIDWSFPRTTPTLERNEVHVWRASLPGDSSDLRRFESVLADDETERAGRFIYERDRDRFIAAHGILRELLGRYISCAPQSSNSNTALMANPRLRTGSPPAISFNLSHSHMLGLIVVAREREVGIDVELLRPDFGGEKIGNRYFSAKEMDELSSLPGELRTEGFFLCWTRKEAYVKARGDELHLPLHSFSVSLAPDKPATLSSADQSRWSMESFVPSFVAEPRYVAAVVAEGKDWKSRYFAWNTQKSKRRTTNKRLFPRSSTRTPSKLSQHHP